MLRTVDPSLLPHQIDVLKDLEPEVADLIRVHDAKRRLWWPTDLLGIQDSDDPEKYVRELRSRAAGIPDAVRISLVMGLITEEGLPHFHRLLAVHLVALTGSRTITTQQVFARRVGEAQAAAVNRGAAAFRSSSRS